MKNLISTLIVTILILSLDIRAQTTYSDGAKLPASEQGVFGCEVMKLNTIDVHKDKHKEYGANVNLHVGDRLDIYYSLPNNIGRTLYINIWDEKRAKSFWNIHLHTKDLNKGFSSAGQTPLARYIEDENDNYRTRKYRHLSAAITPDRIWIDSTYTGELNIEAYDEDKWFVIFTRKNDGMRTREWRLEVMTLDCNHMINNLERIIRSHLELVGITSDPEEYTN